MNTTVRSASRITLLDVSSLNNENNRSVCRTTLAGITNVPSQESGLTP